MSTTTTTVNDNNSSTTVDLTGAYAITTTNATVNLNNSSGNDDITTDYSGNVTINANNSTGCDDIDLNGLAGATLTATVNLNNSTGNDDVDITGTTVNATVNDNNSGIAGVSGNDDIDIEGVVVAATVNLNNSVGNDHVTIAGSTSVNATVNDNNSGYKGGTDTVTITGAAIVATVNLNNSLGNDTVTIGDADTATVNATVNLNNSFGTDIVHVIGATTIATVNLTNSTGGDLIILDGLGTGTINASNSTGSDTLLGENATDTITGGSGGNTVYLQGAGTINAGAGNDLGIYTLSDHYGKGGAADYYYGQAGSNTLRIVLTAAQDRDPTVLAALAAYEALPAGATHTFNFGGNTAALTVSGWQTLDIAVVSAAISGNAREGQRLAAAVLATGGETGTATFQWQYSTDGGSTWSDIVGANASTYVVQETDDGHELRVQAQFTDEIGQTITAYSAPTGAVDEQADAPSLTLTSTATTVEDTAVALSISATAAETDQAPNLSISITGLAGGTLNHGTLNGDGSYTLNLTSDLSGLTYTPASEADGTVTLTVVATDTEAGGGNIASSAPTLIAVTVNPVAEPPSLAGTQTAVSVNEDGSASLTIADALTEVDGDSALATITISGVPTGVTFNNGVAGAGNTWTLDPATDLAGLMINVPDGDQGNFSLSVVATTNDGGNIASSAPTLIAVTVNPVAEPPSLAGTQTAVSVNEDGSASLTIADALTEVDGDSALATITISGVPTGVTFNNGVAGAGNTWTLDPATDLAGLMINVPDGDQGNFSLSVVATTNDGGNIASSAPTLIAVTVNPVAEPPSLAGTQTAVSVNEDGSASLTIADALTEVDGDSALATITISGVPTGVTFNNGVAGAGNTWTLDPATDLAGLMINVPDGDQGNFSLSVVATTNDGGNIASSAPTLIAVTVNPVAEPPSLAGTQTAVSVNEDGSASLTIADALTEVDGDSALATITISGVPTGVTFNNGVAGAGNTWTLDPATDLAGLMINVPDGDQGNFSLSVVATTNDGGNIASSAPTLIAVTVNPVAEPPSLAGTQTAVSVNEDGSASLTIADALTEVDGDSALATITISGVPTGVTFNNGVAGAGNTWTLDPATDLAGLMINVPDGDQGNFSLSVVATTNDGGNIASSAPTLIAVTVNPVAEPPSLAGTQTAVSVNEDGSASLTIADALTEVDGDSALATITISGVPTGVTFNNGVAGAGNTWTLDPATDLAGLMINVPDGDQGNFSLSVVATTNDGGNIASSAPTLIAVTVNPVAEPPSLAGTQTAVSVNEDGSASLTIADALTEVDGDSALATITISGVPTGVTFNNGVAGAGNTWTLDPATDLAGLMINVPDGDQGNFSLSVVATTNDGGNIASSAPTLIAVTVNPVAEPPSLAGTQTAVSVNEDGSASLTIADALTEVDGDSALATITISGVPTGVTFNNGVAGAGNTWTLDPATDLAGLMINVPDGDQGNFSLSVVATTNDGGNIASSAPTLIAVTVNPVAEPPSLAGTQTAVSVNEDGSASLTIADALTEVDGDSALATITISGVPTGVTFNNGVAGAGNTWTLDPATDLAGLMINVPDGDQGNFSLSVVATTNDGGNIASSAPTLIAVTVNPVAEPPSLAGTQTAVSVNEDGSASLTIADALTEVDGDSALATITISGVPTGVTFNNGVAGAGNTWTLDPATDLAGLMINVPDGDQGNFSLSVVATTNDGGNIASSAPTLIAVTVNPVAEPPSLAGTQTAVSVNEDGSASLTIADALTEVDGDSALATITISGVPTGVTFNNGVAGAGNTWTLDPATDLAGLMINVPDGDQGNFSLSVVATTNDGGNIASSAPTLIAVTVNPVAEPPSLAGTQTAVSVNEDGSASLTIADALTEVDGDSALATITISGVPTGVTFNNGVAGAGNTWTLDPATDLAGLMINVPDGDQGNFSLSVVATTNDGGNIASSAPTLIAVTVNPVAEPPSLAGTQTAVSVNEDGSASLTIADALTEVDGDSALATITISGVPTGVTFNNGVAGAGNTWTLDPATDLAGLMINVPDGDQGNFSLSVVATTNDGGNIASSAPTLIAVTVNPVAEPPSLAGTQTAVSVNEDGSASLTIADALTEVDGDSALATITISGVPTGVTFNNGVAGAGNTWTLDPATDLAGLMINVPDGDQGNFSLSVVATTNDGGNIASSAPTLIAVTVNPVAEPPSLAGTQTAVSVNEDGSASLTIADALTEVDGDSALATITISGVPTGVTFNNGVAGAGNTWTLDPATDLAGLMINVPDGDQGNFSLSVVATTNDGGNIASSAPTLIAVTVNPVAEPPSLAGTQTAVSVNEDGSASLTIADALTEVDGDSALATITISGVPTGVTFNNGVAGAGNTWTLDPATDLAGLMINVPDGDQGNFSLSVVATTNDGGNIASSAPTLIAVTVNPVAEPPTASAPLTLTLNENDANVAISGVNVGPLAEDGDDTVSASLTVGHGTLQVGSLSGVTVTGGGTGALTVSGAAAAVNTVLAGLSYTADSEYEGADTLNLSVTSTDGSNTYATPATASTAITVNGVADTPTLGSTSAQATNENTAAALTGLGTVASHDPGTSDDSDTFKVTLSVADGSLSVASHTGLSGTFSGATVTLVGALSSVNTALADNNITYTPTSEFEGSDTLTIDAYSSEDGVTFSSAAQQTATITVADIPTAVSVGVTGTLTEGQTLTATATQTDADAAGHVVNYQWQHSTDGSTWNNVAAGGTSSTYTLAESDEGDQIRVQVTWADDEGVQTVFIGSEGSTKVVDVAPTPATPTISGTAQEGSTLTASSVTTGSDEPLTITYQWQNSTDGTSWSNVASGGSGATYVLQESDENKFVRVQETFTDDTGQSTTLASAATASKVVDNTTLSVPTISGTVQEGSTLTSSTPTVTTDEAGPYTIVYQWQHSIDGSSWSNVTNGGGGSTGTASTYVLQESDESDFVRVQTSYIDDTGQTVTQNSAATATKVQDAAPTIAAGTHGATGNNGHVTFLVTFAESVTGVTTADFTLFGTATGSSSPPTVNSVSSSSGTSITVTVDYAENKNMGLSLGMSFVNNSSVNDGETGEAGPAATNITTPQFSSLAPAGIAGSPINLGLDDPSGVGALTTITVSGVPSDWSLNEGTKNADGSWTVQTTNPSSLAVTTPATFAGAVVLNVSESWTNADGSTGSAYVADNVEAYPASPIFAVSGDDTLTGGAGNNEFVFAQPIANDTVYNFTAASDTIDLIGFGLGGFGDLAIANDGSSNAVVTIGSGETITLKGVDASALSASNFVFDAEPVSVNSGTMTIGDGAILPLGGTIDNTSVIALGSTGDESDLEILVRGASLTGGGSVTLSDNGQNVIFGGDASAVLDNVDNRIAGAGQLGGGALTLHNEGVIDATGTHALVIDTGANAVTNSGTLEAEGAGGLVVKSTVNGGGAAAIGGASSIEFAAASDAAVSFAAGTSGGTLRLDQSGAFNGAVSGFTGHAAIDLADIVDGAGLTLGYAANADGNGGTLSVSDGTHSASLALLGQYAAASDFATAADTSGGTVVTLSDPNQNHLAVPSA